jgi:hypothetical protein
MSLLFKKYNDNKAGSTVSGSVLPRNTLFNDTGLIQSVSISDVNIGRAGSSLFRKRQKEDEKRIEKFLNSSAGQAHTVKEVGLARSNTIFDPSLERRFIDNPSRIINPRKVITNAGTAGSGTFSNKFGFIEGAQDLGYVKFSKNKTNSKLKYLYDKEVSPNLKINPDILSSISSSPSGPLGRVIDRAINTVDTISGIFNPFLDGVRDFFDVPLPLSKLYEYPGGPGSNNGIGLTTIYRYDKLDNPQFYTIKPRLSIFDQNENSNKKQYDTFNYEGNGFWRTSNQNDGDFQLGNNINRLSKFILDNNIRNNFRSFYLTEFGTSTVDELKRFTFTSPDSISTEYKIGSLKPGISDYYTTNPIRLWENRIISRDTKSISSYSSQKTGSLNAFYDSGSYTLEDKFTNYPDKSVTENPDLIDFKLEIIDLNKDSGANSYYLYFKAFIDSFTDDFKANYDTVAYPGNPSGKLYKYQSFDRNINLTFKVAIFSKDELPNIYRKLNRLASTTLPTIEPTDGSVRSTITKLTVGNWCKRLPGVVSGITFQNLVENPWDIDSDVPQILTIGLSYLYSSTYANITKELDVTIVTSRPEIGTTLFGPP